MKSARRHELEKNDLADWVAHKLEGLEEHKNTIAVLTVGIAVAGLLGLFFFTGSDPRNASDWQALYKAYGSSTTTRDLKGIADRPGATPAVLWAKKSLADQQLREGTDALFVNREEAKELLTSANKNYTEVERKAVGTPLLVAEAQLGLARVNESQGDVEEARKYYTKAIATAGKDSVFGKTAAEAAKRLTDPRHTELLAWFQKQEPRPSKPLTGFGAAPSFDDPLPDRPDIGLPGGGPFKNSSKKASSTEENATEGDKPAPEEGEKKDDAKSPEKPAVEPSKEGEPKKETPEPKPDADLKKPTEEKKEQP